MVATASLHTSRSFSRAKQEAADLLPDLKLYGQYGRLTMVNPKKLTKLFLAGLRENEIVLPCTEAELLQRINRRDMGIIFIKDPDNPDNALISITYALTKGYAHSMDGILRDRNMGEGLPDTINFISVVRWEKVIQPDGTFKLREAKNQKGLGGEFILGVAEYLWSACEHAGLNIENFITLSPANLLGWLENMQKSDEALLAQKMKPEMIQQLRRDEAEARQVVRKEVYGFDLDELREILAKTTNPREIRNNRPVMEAQEQLGSIYALSGTFVEDKKNPGQMKFQSYDDVAGFHEGNGAVAEETVPASYGTKPNIRFKYNLRFRAPHGTPIADTTNLELNAADYKAGRPAHSLKIAQLRKPRPAPLSPGRRVLHGLWALVPPMPGRTPAPAG